MNDTTEHPDAEPDIGAGTDIGRRRERVAELYGRGLTQEAIGGELGVDRVTVGRDLDRLRGQWRLAAGRDYDALTHDELVKLDRVERQAWDAWDKSAAAGEPGDPRYLTAATTCVDRRCKLLGLDAPKRTEVTAKASVTHATAEDDVSIVKQAMRYQAVYEKIVAETEAKQAAENTKKEGRR